MAQRVGMEVSVAIGEMVRLANADVIAAYPITPQTHIVEHLAKLVANGELDAEYIPVESEHSAMSACLGASAAGARTFTATAGQGLELMHEVLYIASSMQLPVVMAVVNRALSAPLSVWGDHSDAMACRDTGWIQIFTENGQDVIDNILCAFRIAEDQKVLLPVMVHLDGFHISHVIEPILLPESSDVDSFLPVNKYPLPLDPAKPVAMGDFGPPFIYTEMKWAQEVNLKQSRETIVKVWQEFGNKFKRHYHPVECYRSEDAEVLLLTMGSFSETAMTAIDKMRDEGSNIGLLKLRLWRPFPFDEIRQAVAKAGVLIVLDRALSFGGLNVGVRDITVDDFQEIVNRGIKIAQKGSEHEFEMFGVRE